MKTMIIHFASTLGIFLSMLFSGSSENKFIKPIRRYTNIETNKEVIFVPITHLGTEEQYKLLKTHLDSLKQNGYVTYFEGIWHYPIEFTKSEVNTTELIAAIDSYSPTYNDSLYLDTLFRKTRAILGRNLLGGYDNPDNKSQSQRVQKMNKSGKYVEQSLENLGLTTEKDIWCDYSLDKLIERYEQDYGKINLLPYDFQTPLNSPYESPQPRSTYSFTDLYRERLVLDRITQSEHKKIVLVYGAAHMGMLALDLQYQHGYVKDKKFRIK